MLPCIPGLSPIAYWSFDDQAAETEDCSPNGIIGSLNGGAEYVEGHTGLPGDFAIRFDDIEGVTRFNLTFWYYLDTVLGEGGRVNMLETDVLTQRIGAEIAAAVDVAVNGPAGFVLNDIDTDAGADRGTICRPADEPDPNPVVAESRIGIERAQSHACLRSGRKRSQLRTQFAGLAVAEKRMGVCGFLPQILQKLHPVRVAGFFRPLPLRGGKPVFRGTLFAAGDHGQAEA